jgi:hypothetical protein
VHADPFGGLFKKKDKNSFQSIPVYSGPKKGLAVMPLEDKVVASSTETSIQGCPVPGQPPTSTA